eukprot:TRINITY_DN32610_c0_g1_i1.p1 TRINITY_DN32610_c0_g1~~TRINITY_DN32610_c0_g1_i1.p1  ORF type:complete len:542 (-),score=82.40 TRINITY_DN32610_c0_g1_i1:441-2018(-)
MVEIECDVASLRCKKTGWRWSTVSRGSSRCLGTRGHGWPLQRRRGSASPRPRPVASSAVPSSSSSGVVAARTGVSLEDADKAFRERDFALAEKRFSDVARLAVAKDDKLSAANAWARAGESLLQLGKPFDAAIACERGIKIIAPQKHWSCLFFSALALEALGLLSIAEERMLAGSSHADTPWEKQYFADGLARIRKRASNIKSGDSKALLEEIRSLGTLLGDTEAGYWISCVGERSHSLEGRAELVEKGFLEKADQHLSNPADIARRASYVALRYRVNRKLQERLSAARLVFGIGDLCVLPKVVQHPSSMHVMSEAAIEQLARERLVVIDNIFPEEVMAQMKMEMQGLRAEKMLQNDSNDICNPLQEARYIPFQGELCSHIFSQRCPVIMEVAKLLAGVPNILETRLSCRLAVPQSIMVACYPPKASYKMHLDSYKLQGGYDDVPRKVTLLLYCNVGWKPSMGGKLRTWPAFNQGKGEGIEIEPLPGRLVVFMSEEIWHEVTESHEERFALTLWAHDRDRAKMKT